jgi:hypothetical protein
MSNIALYQDYFFFYVSLPVVAQLLGSKQPTDILEAIEFFVSGTSRQGWGRGVDPDWIRVPDPDPQPCFSGNDKKIIYNFKNYFCHVPLKA